MSGKLIRISPEGEVTCHIWAGRGSWPLKMAQDLVGGYVERIRAKYNGRIRDCLVDEDGLSKNLPPNRWASSALGWRSLVGPVVIWVPDPRPSRKRGMPAPCQDPPGGV